YTCIDSREPLYSKAQFEPTSSLEPIVWESTDGFIKGVGNIADNGDLCVSKEFAELVMSFDPYGIECYPAELRLTDGSLSNRYLLALNNVLDVIDESKSRMRKSPKRNKMLVMELY
ncbi:imm11 family protein, partial [Vibrio parahaemolyticus]